MNIDAAIARLCASIEGPRLADFSAYLNMPIKETQAMLDRLVADGKLTCVEGRYKVAK